MPRRARRGQCSRTGSIASRQRRSRLPRVGYLGNPSSLIGIPRLEKAHIGNKISFGSSALTALAQTLAKIDLANESDWIAAERIPSSLVDHVFRRFLADRGQPLLIREFELSLTLGESIIDTIYGEPDAAAASQLFLTLNTESSFPLSAGDAITELETAHAGMGQAFYDCLRQALYRWIRVYDDWDARERIEQMVEWAEGEDDPESYEIPNLEQDLPACLKGNERCDPARPLASFPVPALPWLEELVKTTIELHRESQSIERPKVDEEFLERERNQHGLDSPLPAVVLYFRAGDAVMACFDDECEFWGQETPEPNLIIPVRPDDPASVLQALAVIETLMQVLVLTVRIKNIIESQEKPQCGSVSMSEANSS